MAVLRLRTLAPVSPWPHYLYECDGERIAKVREIKVYDVLQ